MKTKARVYFSQNGRELTDHPANGLGFLGNGCFVAKFEGRSNGNVFDFLEVEGRDGAVYSLRPSAFDGPVKLKIWYGPGQVESSGFATKADAIARGAVDTGFDTDHCQDDGRGVDFQGWSPWSEYVAKHAS